MSQNLNYPSSKPLDRSDVRSFLQNLGTIEGAYGKAWLHYIALRDRTEMAIRRGQVTFYPTRPVVPESLQLTANVQAGCFELADSGYDISSFLTAIHSGEITGPLGPLKFGQGPFSSITHAPHVPEAQQHRWSTLTLRRKVEPSLNDQLKNSLGWELRAGQQPYDNLDELAAEYACGVLAQDFSVIEILAPNVAAITQNSSVTNDVARVEINLSSALDETKAALGYRIIVGGRCVERGLKDGSSFSWHTHDALKAGTIEFAVPVSSLVQCVAIYDGSAQHSLFIGDPSNSQNPRRVSLEAFDPSLAVVKDLLAPTQKGKSRNFESGVSALFWMLGFSVLHLNDPRHTDAVDLIAITPGGNIAVIECTTGLLKEDTKLANLVSRTYALRRRLNASGSSHVSLLPIMVTSKPEGEITHELAGAYRDGVVVMAVEDVLNVLDTTVLLPNADLWFNNAVNHLEQQQEKTQSQPQL